MNKFEKVQLYYEKGLWDKSRVRNAVVKGWITAEEYESIVGEPYEKGVLTEDDLAEIDTVINAQYPTMVDETIDSTEV